jgi:hypothetical protein
MAIFHLPVRHILVKAKVYYFFKYVLKKLMFFFRNIRFEMQGFPARLYIFSPSKPQKNKIIGSETRQPRLCSVLVSKSQRLSLSLCLRLSLTTFVFVNVSVCQTLLVCFCHCLSRNASVFSLYICLTIVCLCQPRVLL